MSAAELMESIAGLSGWVDPVTKTLLKFCICYDTLYHKIILYDMLLYHTAIYYVIIIKFKIFLGIVQIR